MKFVAPLANCRFRILLLVESESDMNRRDFTRLTVLGVASGASQLLNQQAIAGEEEKNRFPRMTN